MKGLSMKMLLSLIVVISFVTVNSANAQDLPYSPVVEVDGTIYLAGHIGRNPETRELPQGIASQTRQTLENIGATLTTIDANYKDIVRCQVFLDDIEDFSAMNEVYRTYFPKHPPARTTVAVDKIVLDAKIEIECTAVRGFGARQSDKDEG